MRETIESGPNEIVCQKWEESERGWGTRPDGFSLHVSLESLGRYIRTYNATMPPVAPSEYSRPDGIPYPVGVSDEILQEVTESDDGVRYYGNNYPGSGGIDGWKNKERSSSDTANVEIGA